MPLPRGKRGKMKKTKTKYAEQSDEERELARKLLGGKSHHPPAKKEIQETQPPKTVAGGKKPQSAKDEHAAKGDKQEIKPVAQPSRPLKPMADELLEVPSPSPQSLARTLPSTPSPHPPFLHAVC